MSFGNRAVGAGLVVAKAPRKSALRQLVSQARVRTLSPLRRPLLNRLSNGDQATVTPRPVANILVEVIVFWAAEFGDVAADLFCGLGSDLQRPLPELP
jgi:hypothetical protein